MFWAKGACLNVNQARAKVGRGFSILSVGTTAGWWHAKNPSKVHYDYIQYSNFAEHYANPSCNKFEGGILQRKRILSCLLIFLVLFTGKFLICLKWFFRETLWEWQALFFSVFPNKLKIVLLLILHTRKSSQSCICAEGCWSLYLYSAYSNDHPLCKQGKAITISLSKHCRNISEALLSTIWHPASNQNPGKNCS